VWSRGAALTNQSSNFEVSPNLEFTVRASNSVKCVSGITRSFVTSARHIKFNNPLRARRALQRSRSSIYASGLVAGYRRLSQRTGYAPGPAQPQQLKSRSTDQPLSSSLPPPPPPPPRRTRPIPQSSFQLYRPSGVGNHRRDKMYGASTHKRTHSSS
jgi:hypothetical protein